MNYPYYHDPISGAPSGRFSAPFSRSNISNPITPHGIPYNPPEQPQYGDVSQEQQPSRLRRALNFLGKAALVGGTAYALNRAYSNYHDTKDAPVEDRPNYDDGNVVDIVPVRDKVQKFLNTGDVDVEGRPINPGPYESAPRSDRYPSGRGAGGDYLKGVSSKDFKAAGDEPSEIASISVADPEDVGGLRTKKSKDLLSKFRKNIPTTEGRAQTEHPGLDEEIVGVSPEQADRSEVWAFVDNDRFFDHPDVDDHSGADETSNVPHAGQQHLDNYANGAIEKVLFEEFGEEWPEVLEERAQWNRSYEGPEIAGGETYNFPDPASEPGIASNESIAVRRSELTPDAQLKTQLFDKPTKARPDWKDSDSFYVHDLSTKDHIPEGLSPEKEAEALAQLRADNQTRVGIQQAIYEGQPRAYEGLDSMGGLTNIVLQQTNPNPTSLHKISGGEHGRGKVTNTLLDKAKKFSMDKWSDDNGGDGGGGGGINTPSRKTRYTHPLRGNMTEKEWYNQNAFKIARLAVDNPDFDSEAYYDSKKKWIEDQMD